MRTVIGATALPVGLCMALLTVNTAMAFSDAAVWLPWLGGGLALTLLATSFILLRGKSAGGARRWPVVVGALSAGLVGFILAIFTSNSGIQALGDRYVPDEKTGAHELIKGGYELNVRLFDKVVYQQVGPAVTRSDSTGPSQELEALMHAAGWSVVATYVLLFGLVGAVLGVGIHRLAGTQNGIT